MFWIDATSAETAKQSFAKIGKLGGLEATQSAGKHWLSNAEEPWLLIINNADDPSLDLPNLFPEGERGHLLVTTRNPHFKIHGTVGATEFKGLKPMDALLLFLRAADSPRPWTPAVERVANQIIDTLGYLALALIQAGALILQRICGMPDYLDFYKKFRSNIGTRRSLGDPRLSDQLTIYATWEHSLESLEIRQTESCLDAAQLLSTVAFFHFDHIRVDIFTRALDNRLRSIETPIRPSMFSRVSRGFLARIQPPPILPTFLRQVPSRKDPYRIRRALHELRSFSLISYDGKDDSFSLHPVVHCWAKDRLDSGAQLLWAQVALNVLAESVQLPPNDTGETHEDFRRDILVHLDLCLQARPLEILNYQASFGGYKLPFALLLRTTWLFVFREQVLTAAKCGYVYLERGRFHEAARLFSDVKNALVQSRGYKDDKTMSVMLALAATFWGLGRLEEGVALQRIVVDSRTDVYGPDHAETLSAMDQLGKSFWLNGQYSEALKLQSVTMERTKATLGSNHEGTINAMDNLGVTYGSWHKYQESKDLHLRVLAVRRNTLGPTHLDTLVAMNNLAMALMDLGEFSEAQRLINEVYEQRKAKLGKEHPYTLWALCNLAKVMSEQRLLKEAEEMLVDGIAAAKRSLGDDHLGVLMGEGELARVYARQGRLEASENLSGEVIQRLEASRGLGHPDTVYALFKVAQLYEMQGRFDKAIDTCTLASERAEMKLTKEHPMARNIVSQRKRLEECRKGSSGDRADGNLHTTSKEVPPASEHHKSVDVSYSGFEWVPNHLRSCKTY